MKLRNQQVVGEEFGDVFRTVVMEWKDKFEKDLFALIDREKAAVLDAVHEQRMCVCVCVRGGGA